MSTALHAHIAEGNFKAFEANDYPGRGLILGQTPGGILVQVYFLSGRSPDSKRRVLKQDPKRPMDITTALAEGSPGDPKDPLRIYTAMTTYDGIFVVSNGAQTNSVRAIRDLTSGLPAWSYEPDPSSTNRITGAWAPTPCRRGRFDLHILTLRKSLLPSPTGGDSQCERVLFSLHDHTSWRPGFGFGVTTYEGDGDPLPAFRKDPLLFPISSESAEEIGEEYWDALCNIAPDRRAALAVRMINPKTRESTTWIKNEYPELVSAE